MCKKKKSLKKQQYKNSKYKNTLKAILKGLCRK